ncbi:MAG: adenosylcobinamide-GDP ribazoletransferase [Lachnospiraceae bacterium]|nr:adenosylcobinamide-GDP ribazoletransferase [Lachnospiraceae bacterium]
MKVLKSFCVAFAMYSKIPMPNFNWKKENMEYALCFFPFVGIIIGILNIIWFVYAKNYVSELMWISVGVLIPLIISGGIHMDGYMDVMDALHSYGDRKKKLEILKDPHIGAFAVINMLIYYVLYFAGYSQIHHTRAMIVLGAGFYLSRILSGLSAVVYKGAKKEGMLYEFTSKAALNTVRVSLIIQLIICVVVLMVSDVVVGGSVLIASALVFVYVYILCNREFGGVTGDTCGFLSSIVELITVLIAGLLSGFSYMGIRL